MHRVQRVPVTESQGRVHTSAAGVLVMPEAEQVDVTIEEKDLRIDVFRSSGPGGQWVNTTDSAVRITHLPDRHRGQLPEREEPAAEPRAGDAHPAGPAAPGRPGHRRRRGLRRPPARRSAPSTAPSGSAPTTSRRTGSPTTAPATSPTTSTRCSTATSRRSSRPASRPTSRPGSTRSSPGVVTARRWSRRPPPGCADGRGRQPGATTPPSCSPTCSAPPAPRLAARRRASRRRRPQAYDALVARRAAREPLQHLTGTAAFRYVELAVGPGVFVPRPGDRAARRLGRRAGRRPSSTPAGCRSWSTCAPAPGRSRCAVATEVPGRRGARRRARRGRARLGGPQPGRHRGRPAARRHGRRVPRPRRHRRRGGLQPAVHPARGLRVGRPRGPRPRPRRWRCSPGTTAWTRCGSSSGSRPGCCGPAGVVGAEHADVQGESAPAVFAATGPLVRRARPPRPGRSPALRDRAAGTMTGCLT